MQPGKRKPTISIKSVEAALNSLTYTTTDTRAAAALRFLTLVDSYLESPVRPPARDLRDFAVKAIICNIITEKLNHFREIAGLPPVAPKSPKAEAISRIVEDSRSGNPEFLGWSYLYYRYVRVDLGINNTEFEHHSNIEERTIRRYRHHAVQKLYEEIVEREWQARERNHTRRLRAAIPGKPVPRIIGCTQEIELIFLTLKQDRFQTIYITGAPGIGKTEMTRFVAHQLLNRYEYDYVFWIDQAQDYAFVVETLQSQISPDYVDVELQEIFLTLNCLVILDDYQAKPSSSGDVISLLSLLANTTTILTTTRYQPLPHSVTHVHLSELEYEGVAEFIEEFYGPHIPPELGKTTLIDRVYKQVGGNPTALHLYMHQWIEGDDNRLTGKSLHEVYRVLYDGLTLDSKNCWHFFSMLGTVGLDVASLETLFGCEFIERSGFVSLLNSFLLRSHHNATRYALPQSAVQYIAQKAQQENQLRQEFFSQVHSLIQHITPENLPSLGAIGVQILTCEWLTLPDTQARKLIEACLRIEVPDHLAPLWWKAYERYQKIQLQPSTITAFGVCARKLHDYEAAQSLFKRSIASAGQLGDFSSQRQALLEHAILLHRTGKYADALHTLNRLLEQQRTSQEPSAFTDRIYHTLVDISLDIQELNMTNHYLQKITNRDTFRWHQQHVESLILLGDFRSAITFTNAAYSQFEEMLDVPERIATFTALGRSYFQHGEIDNAIVAFSSALDSAIMAENSFLTARAQTNLASALLEIDQLDKAHSLLTDAQQVQSNFSDPVGIAATKQNLAILRRKRSKY